MSKKNVAIIGLGGVGGYFGFKINQTNKSNQIIFIVRGKTFETIKANGLTLLSPEHKESITSPNVVLERISHLRKPDLVILCVKEYDLDKACYELREVITEKTVLLPMMNGADIYERIRSIIPSNPILPSCVYVASHIKEKGIVEHTGKPGKLFLGKDPQNLDAEVSWIKDLLFESGIDFTFRENSLPDIWTKYIFIASFGLVTARYNSSIGEVVSNEFQKNKAIEIMTEIKEIALRKNIDLGEDVIQLTFERAKTFPFQTPTSLQLDVHSGKNENELPLFAGGIIKMGQELGIETPKTKMIYNEITHILKGSLASHNKV
jgi:2-dehydropantoate 2-reductase